MSAMVKVSELSGAALDYWVARAEETLGLLTFDPEVGDMPNAEGAPPFVNMTCGTPHIWGAGKIDPRTHNKETGRPWVFHGPGGTYSPSTDWSCGGPIIEREFMSITEPDPWCMHVDSSLDNKWRAMKVNYDKREYEFHQFGETPLIAAMRCYVASKFGDEVEEITGAQP